MKNEQYAAESFPVGMEVGARRWPYEGAHPACWLEPLKGVVLAADDPRAWAGTWYAHSQAAVDAHLAWCRRENLLDDAIPVLWMSASGEPFVFWSEPNVLRPYAGISRTGRTPGSGHYSRWNVAEARSRLNFLATNLC